jgi:hypothetical protein
MQGRTTKELIETLGEDFDRCYQNILQSFDEGTIDDNGLLDADYEFHARQLIRAAFAYIEAVTFSVKITAATHCLQRRVSISPQERYLAGEVDYDLDDKGAVIERPARIKLSRNIRFALALYERAHKIQPPFDPSSEWWCHLRESTRVRDRLMHPRMPEDLDVSPNELINVIRAKQGFDDILMHYARMKSKRPRKRRKNAKV